MQTFDKYVVSSGIDSVGVLKTVNIWLPLIPFKGHSLDVYHKDTESMLKATHVLIPD